jgi:regulator of protease activity HflC (stomatin/prohibitin superfamily)
MQPRNNNSSTGSNEAIPLSVAAVAGISLLALVFFGWPVYNVWTKGMGGEALLREAESTRRVSVLEATAKRDSAVMLAAAEVERAKGVAEANRIIGASLENNRSYLQYLYITELAEGAEKGNKTIYIPTEGGMPVPTLDIRERNK